MKKNGILVLILLFGFALRIYGINWDQGYHLHPDERFLTMVANAEKLPTSWFDYFIPSRSSLNPYNVGYGFFVYGTFPLTLAKIVAVFLGFDTYADFTIFGRLLSALFDTLVIVMIYKIAELFEKKRGFDIRLKYFASFLYAIAVLPIQLSHFFAVDTFLNFFMIASFYWSLKLYYSFQTKLLKNSVVYILLSAFFFGCALGTKITALFILPLILFFHGFWYIRKKQWAKIFLIFFSFTAITYLTLRFTDPKSFASGNILNPTLNPQFVQNLKELSRFSRKNVWYPPAVQWFSKTPILFPLQNIIFFGVGLPYFLFVTIGSYYFIKEKKGGFVVIGVWMVIFFLYQSTRFAATMRYFIFLYPLFAIFAAFGLVKILRRLQFKLWRLIVLLLVLIWPVSFMSIYSKKHSRIIASEWIENNISKTAFLAEEHWDDFLPVDGGYEGVQMPVFDPDTPEKWKTINEILAKADYYVITSNRGYGSMMKASARYPRMSQLYANLFEGKTAFQKVAEFTSYPTLDFGFAQLKLNDDWAEEAFTVYDHPKVIIFQKVK